jgi:hypothetical protein
VSVSDEVTSGELARSIQELKLMVGGLIGRNEYASDQRALLYRLDELARDLDRERQDRDLAIAAVHQRISDEGKTRAEHRMNWRAWLLTGVLPALATLLGVVLALLFANGGH